MELSQAISKAIKEFGKDIITESRFVNILADYDAFAESRQMRMVVKEMIEQGFIKRLISFDPTTADTKEKINSLVYEALNIFPFREDVVNDFISAMLLCIADIENKPCAKTVDIKGCVNVAEETNWDFFEISEDGKTLVAARYDLEGEVVIPFGIEVIGDYAFSKNECITEVVFSEGIKKIGNGAFCGCSKLRSVQLPESVKEIGSECFANCCELTNIVIPKNVQNIGQRLSYGNVVVDPNSYYLKSIDGTVLSKDGKILYFVPCEKNQMVVPEGVEELFNSCFYNCKYLENVYLPQSLRVISSYAFKGCNSLKKIVIPENVKVLEENIWTETGLKKIMFSSQNPEKIKFQHIGSDFCWGELPDETNFYVPRVVWEKYNQLNEFLPYTIVPIDDISEFTEIGRTLPTCFKTKEDFCHVENIVLGKTTWAEAKKQGYNVESFEGSDSRCVDGKCGWIWDRGGKGYFHSYFVFCVNPEDGLIFPNEWEALGITNDLSYDKFISLFKKWGFRIKVIKSPQIEKLNQHPTSAKVCAESYDKSITFTLDFVSGDYITDKNAKISFSYELFSIEAEV